MKKHLVAVSTMLVLAITCRDIAAQVTATKPPNSNITPLGPQPQQPTGGRRSANRIGQAPPPTKISMNAGTVFGFVYWDAKVTSHLGSSVCNALAITVAVASKSPYTPFGAVGTQSHVIPIATVHPALTSVNTTSYDGCAYTYDNAPLGQNLYVAVGLTHSLGTLTPAVVAKNPAVGPIHFSNTPCSKLPPLTKATMADITGNWGTCQNVAYDVNLPLMKTAQLTVLNSSIGSGGNQNGTRSGLLLNQARPTGMLNNPSAQSTGTGSSPGTPGQLLPAKPGAGGTVQLNPQPLPPKGVSSGPGSSGAKVQLNPQPYPPKGKTTVSGSQLSPNGKAARNVAFKPLRLPAPTAMRKIANPRLAQQNASIMAALDQQRQAAQQESSAMKSAIGSASNARTVAVAANFHGNMPATGLQPGHTQSAPGNTLSSIAKLPYFNSLPVTCSHDTTPRVLWVNGGQGQGIFTPEAKYNQYTIAGCTFGQAQGTAHIFAPNGFTAILYIDYWSDNGITAHLDPALAGVLDQNNVTLVVVPPGQQQIQKSGFRFYAARGMPLPDGSDQEVPLAYNSMPQAGTSLFNIANLMVGFNQLPSNASSNFPSFSFQGTPVAGWIFRYGYGHCDRIATTRTADCYANGNVPCNAGACDQFFGVGAPQSYAVGTKWMPWSLKSDTWDFSKLAPGFQISDYQLFVSTLDPTTLCGAWDDMSHTGYFDPDWAFNLTTQNQISVTWAVNRCDDEEFGTRNNMAVQSAYGLAVWVMGPRCIDPWTGQKNQSCMANVKQILG